MTPGCGGELRILLPDVRARRPGKETPANSRTAAGGSQVTATSHPCQYSPEVLEVLAGLIQPGERIHDPFAGPGLRLGQLCNRRGAVFSGGDLDGPWADGVDPRVVIGADARDPSTYPAEDFTITCSPVYVNKRCCDYPNGPTPTTKTKGRRDYGIALGRPLHRNNLARTTGRPGEVAAYWQGHADAVKHWGERVIVNVDQPIADRWCRTLEHHGYTIQQVIPAYTRRYGGLDNAEKRAECEVVIVAHK
jgi:hypothetical protein